MKKSKDKENKDSDEKKGNEQDLKSRKERTVSFSNSRNIQFIPTINKKSEEKLDKKLLKFFVESHIKDHEIITQEFSLNNSKTNINLYINGNTTKVFRKKFCNTLNENFPWPIIFKTHEAKLEDIFLGDDQSYFYCKLNDIENYLLADENKSALKDIQTKFEERSKFREQPIQFIKKFFSS